MKVSSTNKLPTIEEIKYPQISNSTVNLLSIKNTASKMERNHQEIENLRKKILPEIELSKKVVTILVNHLIEITNQQIKNEHTEANLYSEKQVKILANKKNSIDNNFKKLEEKYQKAFEFTTQYTDEIVPKINKIYDETINLKEKIIKNVDTYFSSDNKNLPDILESQNLSINEINNLLMAAKSNDK
ncbi:hypothetical protein JEP40_14085 [Proteus vulgaris]|uniref:hypothetical protein n=1 Tax=Proteus vulgaris TaxID=585 RepID=UPI0018E3FAC8|nr:hypothetical protein [Proteus vulgaris]MBI6530237.1 hypothetical protein [Proteus vulgaris]